MMDDLKHYNPEGSDLRKAQLRMQEILDVFDSICRKHNINYWLISGTLLGARRHGGFIPWDDDLDVAVLQSDHKNLLTILKNELPQNLKLQAKETDKNYWFYWAKIRDTNSVYLEKSNERYNFDERGIFIDIFSLEPVPGLGFKKIMDKLVLSEKGFKKAKSLYERVKYTLLICLLPATRLLIKLTRIYYKYIRHSKAYSYSYGIFYYANYNMKYFLPAGEIMFEGKSYKAPNDVDKYLTDKYGPDFMVVPKASDRETHASKIQVL